MRRSRRGKESRFPQTRGEKKKKRRRKKRRRSNQRMANVLDLRRRIRSVKSTRQITKAMKMIAAAKLRRAQERAISGRPYANMLASVIGSLMRHIELYDPQTG